jgi:hypothetical protein
LRTWETTEVETLTRWAICLRVTMAVTDLTFNLT